LDFDLSQLTSLQFIEHHVAGFYKPTIPQSLPSHLQYYSTCNIARLGGFFVPNFDPNKWCLKNCLRRGEGGLNIGPLGHEFCLNHFSLSFFFTISLSILLSHYLFYYLTISLFHYVTISIYHYLIILLSHYLSISLSRGNFLFCLCNAIPAQM
jgi:hypothetical protein